MISVFLIAALTGDPLPILFFGNSHTTVNDCPAMVQQLLMSDGSGRKIQCEVRTSSFLEEFASDPANLRVIKSRQWFAIIMQGIKISSSHKYQYDHRGALTLAEWAKQHSKNPVFFAEWPRRGWNEADWIVSQYVPISKSTNVPVAAVGLSWPPVLKEFPNLKLWVDGNHATPTGTYLAACGLYYALVGAKKEPTWRPRGVDETLASRLRAHARTAWFAETR